jgi:cobalt-zinc-cadmium efflux system protein
MSGFHEHNRDCQAHGHAHDPVNFGRTFALAAGLNIALVIAQVIYGLLANSVALLADAGHNFGDVLGLLLAWGASHMAKWHPTSRYTYGFRSASILAALLNALILLLATGGIAWEAIRRFSETQTINAPAVMIVAAIGIAVNGISARLLMAGRRDDLNVRGAFLHLLGDAAISGGVVLAGAIIYLSGLTWIDPAVSLVIAALIVWATWGLLREAVKLSLAAVPETIDPAEVRGYLQGLPGVCDVHDLHIWAISTAETALTAHLVRPDAGLDDALLHDVARELEARFGISHATLQIELNAADCRLAPASVV